jgi:crossover junction endodeoxyribonuclease RuvC
VRGAVIDCKSDAPRRVIAHALGTGCVKVSWRLFCPRSTFGSAPFTLPRMGISPQQFEQLQNRVKGRRRPPRGAVPKLAPTPVPTHQIILGVDPSLRGTGYGVIRLGKPDHRLLAQGTISCPAGWERSRCLVKIMQVLREVLAAHRPTVCVIEGLFFAQNLQTAMLMGEARGAALAALAEAGLEIYELAPRKVKQAIVGYGAAQKIAVARMVQRMLHLEELPAPDAADALALALAHAQETGRFALTAPKRI